MKIPFNKPFIAGKELFYIAQAVLVESRLSGDGAFTRKCHAWLEERLGCRRAFLTHSCTAALEMAAILCDLGPGDEVIMPSFTFVSTANAFVMRGATPVFVDIRPDTFNIDEGRIEAALSPRTKAVVVVHYGGAACEMARILALAEKHRLRVIEDAAHALLSTYGERALGSIGDLGCLSFHETKNIISGEGGALLVNAPDLAARAEIIREKGTNRSRFFRNEVDKYTWVDIGSSYLPSELTAAFLWAQLEQADGIIGKRRRLFQRYMDRLAGLEAAGCIRRPLVEPGHAGNGHLFHILTGSLGERDALIAHLKKDGILAVFHYVPLHASPAGRRFGRTGGQMTVTDDISDRLLRLPLYYELSEKQLDQVVASLERFYGAGGGSLP
jgi:dTDP-4-amino-4,6-dideoxygalactose transaminase